ncbi:DoxX family protein [Subtercola sp. YIM 133946]|uniref:DoxX family protein n=1 Tax=Subtercola sp. YIM 133946 TaxID=3118909 RepID=UPI002F93B1E9
MQIAYWIVAGVLGVFYLYSGGAKLLRTRERLQPMMKWVRGAPMGAVRLIGALEVLAVIGLVLPPLTGVAPGLALAAAVGLVLVQVAAIILHLVRGEARQLGLNVGLLVLAGVAAWLAMVWL